MTFTTYDFNKSAYQNYKDKVTRDFFRLALPTSKAKKIIPKVMKGQSGEAVSTNNIPEINTNYRYFKRTGWEDNDGNVNTFLTEAKPYIDAIGGVKNLPRIKDVNWGQLPEITDPTVIDIITGYGNGFEAVDTVSPYEREFGGVTTGRSMIGLLEFKEFANKYGALNGPVIVPKSGRPLVSTFPTIPSIKNYKSIEYADIRTVAKLRDVIRDVIPSLGTTGIVSFTASSLTIKTESYWKAVAYGVGLPKGFGSWEFYNSQYTNSNSVYLSKEEGSDTYFAEGSTEEDTTFFTIPNTQIVATIDSRYASFPTEAVYEDLTNSGTIPPTNDEWFWGVSATYNVDENGDRLQSREDYLDDAATSPGNPFNVADAFSCLAPYLYVQVLERAGLFKTESAYDDLGKTWMYPQYNRVYMSLDLFVQELQLMCGRITEIETAYGDIIEFEAYENTDLYKYLDLSGGAKQLLDYNYGRVDTIATTLKLALGKDGSTFRGSAPVSDSDAYEALIRELGTSIYTVLYPVILKHEGTRYIHVGYMINWDALKTLPPNKFMAIIAAMYGYIHTNTPNKSRNLLATAIQIIAIVVTTISGGPQSGWAMYMAYAGAAITIIGIVTDNSKLIALGQAISLVASVGNTISNVSNMSTLELTIGGLSYALNIASYVQSSRYEKKFAALTVATNALYEETNEMQEILTPRDGTDMIKSFIYEGQHTSRYDNMFNYDIHYSYV